MDRLEKEYREFGPWILEIKTQDDIPDLFREDYTYDNAVDCAIKIPIPLDRRDAEKGMDFYKSLISFNREEVLILNKTAGRIEVNRISYKSIKSLKNMIDLLEAKLTIYTDTKNYKISYSSVSEDIMNKVIDILRIKYISGPDTYSLKTEYRGEITDPLFRNLINDSNKKGAVAAVSYQKTTPVRPRPRRYPGWPGSPVPHSGMSRPVNPRPYRHPGWPGWSRPVTKKPNFIDFLLFNFHLELQSYIFLKTENELIAVNRNKEIKKRRAVDYSYNYTYIPFSNIESAEFIPDPEFPDIYIFKISLKKSESLTFMTHMQTKKEFKELTDQFPC